MSFRQHWAAAAAPAATLRVRAHDARARRGCHARSRKRETHYPMVRCVRFPRRIGNLTRVGKPGQEPTRDAANRRSDAAAKSTDAVQKMISAL